MRWYEGVRGLPLRLWERRRDGERRGDNVGNVAVLPEVRSACRALPATPTRGTCGHFPLECDTRGKPIVAAGCGRSRSQKDAIFLSHAWPRAAEVPRGSRSVDPSINTFVNAPRAPELLRAHWGGAASELRFIVLLREPVDRVSSSVRMMTAWGWEKAKRGGSNESAVARDVRALRACAVASGVGGSGESSVAGATLAAATAAALQTFDDARLATYRQCLAKGNPLNHVRAGGTPPPSRGSAPLRRRSSCGSKRRRCERWTARRSSLNRPPPACRRPTAALPSAVRGACSDGGSSTPPTVARALRPALPPAEAELLRAVYAPFKRC